MFKMLTAAGIYHLACGANIATNLIYSVKCVTFLSQRTNWTRSLRQWHTRQSPGALGRVVTPSESLLSRSLKTLLKLR